MSGWGREERRQSDVSACSRVKEKKDVTAWELVLLLDAWLSGCALLARPCPLIDKVQNMWGFLGQLLSSGLLWCLGVPVSFVAF